MPKKRTSAYRAKTYRPRRLALIKKLGGRCVWPNGCDERRVDRLEFDHVEADEFDFGKLSRWVRIARYEREAAEGKIQLLCRYHNKVKGVASMAELFPCEEAVPF